MTTYKELAEHLEAYFKNAHRMDEVIAILRSLDAQPVAEVSVMGSYHGKPILGCVLSNGSMQVGDKLYAAPLAAQAQQASKLLSDAEIESGVPMHRKGSIAFRDGVRWAEQRHGIKERG